MLQRKGEHADNPVYNLDFVKQLQNCSKRSGLSYIKNILKPNGRHAVLIVKENKNTYLYTELNHIKITNRLPLLFGLKFKISLKKIFLYRRESVYRRNTAL